MKISDILFGSEYKREIQFSQDADGTLFLVRWNEFVVIMHSYAEFIEMKRAINRNYAFARIWKWSERVFIIRSLRASPAFRFEYEASSKLSKYTVFRPRRIKRGVNWYSGYLCST